MPLNGSGTYNAPASSWNPAVDNTDIDSTDWNALLADLQTSLSLCMFKDGQQVPTHDIPMGSFKLTGLADAIANNDAANLSQVHITCKVGSFSRDISLTADQTISGVGFSPRFIFFLACINGTSAMSVGMASSALVNGCIFDDSVDGAGTYGNPAAGLVIATGSLANNAGSVSAVNSDGFVLSWSKAGSPTGTATVYYGAIK